MKTVKMVCMKPNTYGNKRRAFGDEVEVGGHEVGLVTALGWFVPFVEDKNSEPVKAAPKIQTRAIVAAQPPVFVPQSAPDVEAVTAPDKPAEDQADTESKPKRAYQRRDLTAEP